MKKKVYVIVLTGVLALSLCACGEQKSEPVEETSIQQEETQQNVVEDKDETNSKATESENVTSAQNQNHPFEVITTGDSKADIVIGNIDSLTSKNSIRVYAGDYCFSLADYNGQGEVMAYLEKVTDENGSTSVLNSLTFDYNSDNCVLVIHADLNEQGIAFSSFSNYVLEIYAERTQEAHVDFAKGDVVMENSILLATNEENAEESKSDENSTNNSIIDTDTQKPVDYVGTYYGSNGTDTITLNKDESNYQLTNMVIDHEVYYVDGQMQGNLNEMSTTFSAGVGENVTISTYYGCEGTVTLNKDGSISLTLSCNGKSYSGTFTK